MKTKKHGRIDVESHMVLGKTLEWDDEELLITDPRVALCLTWYNYNHNRSDAKKFIIEYYRNIGNKEMQEKAKDFDEDKIIGSVGWICDMISNGANLVDEAGVFTKKLEDMERKPEKYTTRNKIIVEENKDGRKQSPKERMWKFANEYISVIDANIDEFIENKCNELDDFDLHEYLGTIKNGYYPYIMDAFKGTRDELRDALESGDKDLLESYSFLTKPQIKRYLKYIESIYTSIEKIKKTRKKEAQKLKKKKPKKAKKKTIKKVKTEKTHKEGLEAFL